MSDEPSYTQKDLDDARDEGYKKGHEEGYSEGYSEGYDEGYEKGECEGEDIIQGQAADLLAEAVDLADEAAGQAASAYEKIKRLSLD